MDDSRNLVRVGIVSAIDADTKSVRVHYPQFDNMVSDWLPVLHHSIIAETTTEGAHNHLSEVPSDGAHQHNLTSLSWMPRVNDRVLVLYTQGFSTDGYVLGVLL